MVLPLSFIVPLWCYCVYLLAFRLGRATIFIVARWLFLVTWKLVSHVFTLRVVPLRVFFCLLLGDALAYPVLRGCVRTLPVVRGCEWYALRVSVVYSRQSGRVLFSVRA